jgi:hypothetical protein
VSDEARDRVWRSVAKREKTQGLIVRVYITNSWVEHHQTVPRPQDDRTFNHLDRGLHRAGWAVYSRASDICKEVT